MQTATGGIGNGRRSPALLALWSMAAAFGAYFCMYAFRKPFTAAAFTEPSLFGLSEKTVLVTAQVFGYMLSKFIGIRVISEMPPQRRAVAILVLVGIAEVALLLFAIVPPPLQILFLFINGLPLGMVFGLVLGFLEGRRNTEALAAGLCASFIVADGVTKSVGSWLLEAGVSEHWMPVTAGFLFVPALLLFVWMLTRIPPPDMEDVSQRSERTPMHHQDRVAFVQRTGLGLLGLLVVYVLITVVRSIRADFAPEIWASLGVSVQPRTYANSEIIVAMGVLVVNGMSVLIVDNRKAFFVSLGIMMMGALLMLGSLFGLRRSWLGGFEFMVLMGLGLYLPYVAMHTTIFERLIAMTRERGNLGFPMYLADSLGYLGYVTVMIGKGLLPTQGSFLPFFTTTCLIVALFSALCVLASGLYFARYTATVRLEQKLATGSEVS